MPDAARTVAGGRLRDRVRVLAPTTVISVTGGTVAGTPTTVISSLWCAIEPLDIHAQLQEHLAAGGLKANVTHIVRCRRTDAITAAMTLIELDVAAPRTLTIVIRRLDPRVHELHLLCQEAV